MSVAAHLPRPTFLVLPLSQTTSGRRELPIGLIGPGRVGQALLRQIQRQAQPLLKQRGLTLNLRGVLSRKQMWLDCDDPALNSRLDGAQTWRPAHLDEFVRHVQKEEAPVALVDCSGQDIVADRYSTWLAQGIHVVTPSKLAGSGDLKRWEDIQGASRLGGHFRYETTVGAGLPVIQPLNDLMATGDELLEVDGMLSGTLAWLCHRMDGKRPFSDWLREAHAQGYTEPDPRDDLSGLDVARKLVILARTAGHPLTLDQVRIENLVPEPLRHVPLPVFLDRLHELDGHWHARFWDAHRERKALRHVAHWDPDGGARVELQALPDDHPFARSRSTDNVIQFRTERYREAPMIIQGPGAGPEVTAAGLFAEVLRLADL